MTVASSTLSAGRCDGWGLSVSGHMVRLCRGVIGTASSRRRNSSGSWRGFGCCRVVFNDALRVRDEAHRAGVKLSDSEIQRRVVTQAKTTEERGWLAEVPSVALVQSVNDARRAWRNFFDSHTGKRNGRKVGLPRMKSKKDHRQSFGSPATDSACAVMVGWSWRRWARCGCAGRATCPPNRRA